MLYYKKEIADGSLNPQELSEGLFEALDKIGKKKKVLAVPPDITRFYSYAGILTKFCYDYYKENLTDILPATGTHFQMTSQEIEIMYAGVPQNLFRAHDWKNGVTTIGTVASEIVNKESDGLLNYSIEVQIDKLIHSGKHDLILSIGQVVPHEVIGIANYNKNILIGTGGKDIIGKSHFLGAVYGMERIMGRSDTPVRRVLNYASDNFLNNFPIVYVLTVVRRDEKGDNVPCGLFIGDDIECYNLAADLSFRVNIELLEKPLKKIVVFLEPQEFKSTWIGNKSIYRTRMAIEDGGELIILAPGVKAFGEDKGIDSLVRKYGYVTTPEVLKFIEENDELKNNLGAAAHLIHGSSENRFKITYCPGKLSKEEIINVNYNFDNIDTMIKKYKPEKLKDGLNILSNGEEIFYISNPALGLWASKDKFKSSSLL